MSANLQIFNFQKPGSRDSQTEGQSRLNKLLFELLKHDKAKQPEKYSQTLHNLTAFLNQDERAPGPQNPFLGANSLKIVIELGKRQKLPSLNSGLQPDNAPWNWNQGLGSLLIAAKLTETKNLTVSQIQKHAEELAQSPKPDPVIFQRDYQSAVAPYHELLEKFVPPTERDKHKQSLETEGNKILTNKLAELKHRGDKLGVGFEEADKIEENVLKTHHEARKFANSEEYIQHRLANWEDFVTGVKRGGKLSGDMTIGAGVLFFAPTTVVPFIVAGYISHRLSTLNVNTLKDWREQKLRDQVQKSPPNLEKASAKEFTIIPQKLGAYLKTLNFLPHRSIEKDSAKTQTVPAATSIHKIKSGDRLMRLAGELRSWQFFEK